MDILRLHYAQTLPYEMAEAEPWTNQKIRPNVQAIFSVDRRFNPTLKEVKEFLGSTGLSTRGTAKSYKRPRNLGNHFPLVPRKPLSLLLREVTSALQGMHMNKILDPLRRFAQASGMSLFLWHPPSTILSMTGLYQSSITYYSISP